MHSCVFPPLPCGAEPVGFPCSSRVSQVIYFAGKRRDCRAPGSCCPASTACSGLSNKHRLSGLWWILEGCHLKPWGTISWYCSFCLNVTELLIFTQVSQDLEGKNPESLSSCSSQKLVTEPEFPLHCYCVFNLHRMWYFIWYFGGCFCHFYSRNNFSWFLNIYTSKYLMWFCSYYSIYF